MKLNKDTILKNLSIIICGVIIIGLFFPFVGVSASASAGGFSVSTDDEAVNGITMVLGSGFFGILMGLAIILIIISGLVPQLKPFRKIVSVAASVIGVISTIAAPSIFSASSSGGGVSSKTEISHYFGFWLVLICFIVLTALSVIQLLNLKGNKFFDSINNDSSDGGSANNNSGGGAPNIGFSADKLKGMAQNAASNISNAAGGIKNQVSEKMSQHNNASNNSANSQPNNNYQQQAAQPQQYAPIHQTTDPSIQKGDPEEIMKQIKGLHEMKEAGILTEEEFAEKKQEFLKKL